MSPHSHLEISRKGSRTLVSFAIFFLRSFSEPCALFGLTWQAFYE